MAFYKLFQIHAISLGVFFLKGKSSMGTSKPRLVRQHAVHEECSELSCSPPRLGVRFLPTIPSAADSSIVLDEESHNETGTVTNQQANHNNSNNNMGAPFYAILHSGNTLTTLSSPKSNKLNKPP